MGRKGALILLGGSWHDFAGFAASVSPLLAAAGLTPAPTYDPDDLLRLRGGDWELVVLYTCLGGPGDGAGHTVLAGLADRQVAALTAWVRGGGALLGMHSATVMGESGPGLGALLGGTFVSHPARHAFTVYPMATPHAIIEGIEAFTIDDELYLHRCETGLDVHAVAVEGGVAHPMVWTRREGKGRVAYLAPGHDAATWGHPSFQTLLRQTAGWAIHS